MNHFTAYNEKSIPVFLNDLLCEKMEQKKLLSDVSNSLSSDTTI